MCRSDDWQTMLNKHFQREVRAVRVFCQNKGRGCKWEGELADFERHVPSCKIKVKWMDI